MDSQSLIALGLFLAAVFVTASSGAVFRPGPWYDNLRKPSWNPPKWLFPLAWSLLYLMIAVAGWLVWRAAGLSGGALPIALFALQLVFNAAWSFLFFGRRRVDWALYEVALLWLSIAAMLATFWPVDRLAAYLLVPYFLWVSFAAFLNLEIWRLNSAVLMAGGAKERRAA